MIKAQTALLLAMILVSSVFGGDWPQWLGPNRDGISPEKGSQRLLPAPRRLWTASVGAGVCSVVVGSGRAYTLGHVKGPKGQGTDTVYCLDALSGNVLWKHSYQCRTCWTQDVRFDGPRSTPAVDGDAVYTLSLEGHLFCLDKAAGNVLWSKELTKDLGGRIPTYGYCCAPLIYGRLLLLELNAPGASYVALDKTSGDVVWKCAAGSVVSGSPVLSRIDGRDCAVFMGGGEVVGLDAATGHPMWRHHTWGHAWMGPVVSGNKVFVANASLPRGCGLIRIDNGRPTVLWEAAKKFQTLHCNCVIWQGHIYGFDNTGTDEQGTDSKKSSLKCIELDTGNVRWVQEKMGWANLIVFDGKLIILTEKGDLVIADFSPEGLRERIRTQVLDGRCWTVPALADARLYCRDNSGDVVCLELLGAADEPQVAGLPVRPPDGPGIARPSQGAADLRTPVSEPPAARPATDSQGLWPRFRGPLGAGIAPFSNIPVECDIQSGKGVLWKTPVPLPGESSPVVWAGRVFLSGANARKREVYCFDADSGRLLWSNAVASPDPGGDDQAQTADGVLLAAPTLVADGPRVYAVFGTGDVACLDFDGRSIWTRGLGMPTDDYGHSSSLALWRNLLLIQWDQGSAEDGKSVILALDTESGRTVWQTNRRVGCSWSSPIVIDAAGRAQLITCADPWVIAYDPATGAEIWRAECMGGQVVPSPIFVNGMVIAASVDGCLAAIRPDGIGDVTKTHILWAVEDDLPAICSPASNRGLVFVISSGGQLTCYDFRDGRKIWQKEFDVNFQASPTIVGDLVYLLNDRGTMHVLGAARQYEPAGRMDFAEQCRASPAFAPGRMYVRTMNHLYCITGR